MSGAIKDRRAFILANTRLIPPPLVPEISLRHADEAMELWRKTEEELGEMGLPPPYWAFAWAGGQALARYIGERPETVTGKRVLDFASGSGVVAIAAAKAGASRVEASDIDDFALAAIALNAEMNGVKIHLRAEDLVGRFEDWDVVLAGDVSYEHDMARAATDWLQALAERGVEAFTGDPGRAYFAREKLTLLAEYSVPVTRALEDSEIKHTGVYQFLARG